MLLQPLGKNQAVLKAKPSKTALIYWFYCRLLGQIWAHLIPLFLLREIYLEDGKTTSIDVF